jgi:transcriptional regulator with XRE-family HTH domain
VNFKIYLRTLLASRGLNQRKLATLTGIDNGQISRHLSGEFVPSTETLEKFTCALTLTTEGRLELYRLAGRMPPEFVKAFCSSKEVAQLFQRCLEKQ